MYRFPGAIVQFLGSLKKSHIKYGLRIYRFPESIVSLSPPTDKNDESRFDYTTNANPFKKME
jgi:hypothetical protein